MAGDLVEGGSALRKAMQLESHSDAVSSIVRRGRRFGDFGVCIECVRCVRDVKARCDLPVAGCSPPKTPILLRDEASGCTARAIRGDRSVSEARRTGA